MILQSTHRINRSHVLPVGHPGTIAIGRITSKGII